MVTASMGEGADVSAARRPMTNQPSTAPEVQTPPAVSGFRTPSVVPGGAAVAGRSGPSWNRGVSSSRLNRPPSPPLRIRTDQSVCDAARSFTTPTGSRPSRSRAAASSKDICTPACRASMRARTTASTRPPASA
jgi:hypothetical protein